jgi:hypothetical protein
MEDHTKRKIRKKARIQLTIKDLELLCEHHGTESAAELAERTGLPYMLMYNLVHRRTSSVNNRQYEMLFGKPAPAQEPLKIDGTAFRAMAHLWLYLDQGITQAALYRELFNLKTGEKSDPRIFSGKIGTIDARLEHAMREKFLKVGIDGPLLDQWLDEFEEISHEHMIPYVRIRPILKYLDDHLGIPPKRILNQSLSRYEKGELSRVSRRAFEMAKTLKRRAEIALQTDGEKSKEAIRESILGRKRGYTLFSDIEEELSFLREYTGKSSKRYLGRSLWTYRKGKAKRISNARARRILSDVDKVIQESPWIRLHALPTSRNRLLLARLMNVLSVRMSQLLTKEEGVRFEKKILNPSRARNEYKKQDHGFTPLDMASGIVGMKRKAFDLMVSQNCEIFRTVLNYDRRWYLSDLYLREIKKKKEFKLISAKYERLAKGLRQSRMNRGCKL